MKCFLSIHKEKLGIEIFLLNSSFLKKFILRPSSKAKWIISTA